MVGGAIWWRIVWFAPAVRAIALSQSFPTPITIELLRVVVNDAVGAPGFALPVPVAPIAPDPLVPDVSTPAKLITSIDEATLWERVAVAVAFEIGFAAKALQISAVPS